MFWIPSLYVFFIHFYHMRSLALELQHWVKAPLPFSLRFYGHLLAYELSCGTAMLICADLSSWEFYNSHIISTMSIRNIWHWIIFLKFWKLITEKKLMLLPWHWNHCSVITWCFYFQCYNRESLEERNTLASYINEIDRICYVYQRPKVHCWNFRSSLLS